ncbi:MAG: hypothetical protein WBZ04_10465 [Candidatus Nanopelagicales bacterium]
MTTTSRYSRPRLTLAGGLLCIAALCGCSQVKGLAVQGNMNVIYLETAATDVLVAQQIGVQSKPVCTVNGSADYSCTGTATGGAPIDVTVPETAGDPIMVITVGGATVFTGSVLDVIEANSQASP